MDQDRDAGKTKIRELWEESKGRNMVGDWNPQKNVASEKSPRAPCLKSFLELQCPIFNSKSFLWLNPSPPLFKISVQSTGLGWSKESQDKEVNSNLGWHRAKERRESQAMNVNAYVSWKQEPWTTNDHENVRPSKLTETWGRSMELSHRRWNFGLDLFLCKSPKESEFSLYIGHNNQISK